MHHPWTFPGLVKADSLTEGTCIILEKAVWTDQKWMSIRKTQSNALKRPAAR
jgi:hypothetical protein